jgi:hypothetical protein
VATRRHGDGIEQQDEAADEISVTFDALPAPPAAPVTTLPGPSLRPSNAFSILTPKLNARTGAATLGSGSPAPASSVGSSLPRCTQGARPARSQSHGSPGPPPRAGVITVKLTPSRRAMRRLRERRRLAVSPRAIFTPKGGTARTVTRGFALRLARH